MGFLAGSEPKLKKTFKKFGDVFEYIKHEGDWYLYKRIPYKDDAGYELDEGEGLPHYEVVKALQRYPRGNKDDKVWMYPANSDWGDYGFTYVSMERANSKFKEMVNG